MSDASKTSELLREAREWRKAQLPESPWGEGHIVNRLADALESATRVPVQGEPNDAREALRDEFRSYLGDEIYVCSRDYSAWSHGTMGFDDFSLAAQDDEIIESLVGIALARATVPDAATEELETLRDIAETHAFCADRLSIETERADWVSREVCDRGCSYTGGPDEECSAHGRTPRELWEFIAQDVVGRDAATERAEKAEAERDAALAAVERCRKLHHKITRYGNEDYSIDAEQFEEDPESYPGLRAFDLCAECYAIEKEICEECGGDCGIGLRASWPCPTVAALDGAPEPEVKP